MVAVAYDLYAPVTDLENVASHRINRVSAHPGL